MPDDRDHYAAYYADKLWNPLPALYRTEDTDAFDKPGPLRELVNRIGAQAAVLRRSIDRLWEDQSIETCDDWVISYIADLLATRLVASLDARGQRLDVAKTIYYRRRAGTVAILEEIATDITGWNARVVEFFRRLARTRHGLDPAIGLPSATEDPEGNHALQAAQGLVGALTYTSIGGFADLHNAYGASKAHSAFDEFFHTADLRRGRGQVGWHNIPRLGVFLWRLYSFPTEIPRDIEQLKATPVADTACTGHYTFDPTGREIPLFAAAARAFGDNWTSPLEWQLPAPISTPLLGTHLARLYPAISPIDGSLLPNSLAVFDLQGNLIPASQITADPNKLNVAFFIYPEKGRLVKRQNAPAGDILVTYHYGFSSNIGAGPYDRRIVGETSTLAPSPESVVSGGGNACAAPLGSVAPTGTVTISDSLTYVAVSDVGNTATGIQQVKVLAENKTRPLVRLPAPAPNVTEWVFTGAEGSALTLEGLFVSGGDIVLRGDFDSIALTCCTLDPGNSSEAENPPMLYAKAVDGRDLVPCHLWIEGQVRELTIKRSIVGPIAARGSGEVETLTVTDSIVQALGTEEALHLTSGEVELSRCTVLGPATVHRLNASECILDEVVRVEDPQHGCVRFSAWATGSVLPRQFESVEIAPKAPLFTTRAFGQPGYAQMLAGADAAILSGARGATISQGAADGSEMGAFARDKAPIKERSLLIKYQEFMPLGLIPVIVHAT